MNEVSLERYKQFVDGVTSATSKSNVLLQERMTELQSIDFEVARVFTAGLGLSGEVGEFNEILKKVFFHGKPLTDELKVHLKKELGDICWYVVQAALALNVDLNQIIEDNVDKLLARYPGGEFSVFNSENREIGDV